MIRRFFHDLGIVALVAATTLAPVAFLAAVVNALQTAMT